MKLEYNEAKMKKLIQSDMYLNMVYKDMMIRGRSDEETIIRVLYNANVDNDGRGDYRHVYMDMRY